MIFEYFRDFCRSARRRLRILMARLLTFDKGALKPRLMTGSPSKQLFVAGAARCALITQKIRLSSFAKYVFLELGRGAELHGALCGFAVWRPTPRNTRARAPMSTAGARDVELAKLLYLPTANGFSVVLVAFQAVGSLRSSCTSPRRGSQWFLLPSRRLGAHEARVPPHGGIFSGSCCFPGGWELLDCPAAFSSCPCGLFPPERHNEAGEARCPRPSGEQGPDRRAAEGVRGGVRGGGEDALRHTPRIGVRFE